MNNITSYFNVLTIQDGKPAQKKPIERLSDDVLLNIFSYVFPADLGRMAQTSKRFQALTSADFLWNQVTVKTLYPWSYVIDEKVWSHPDLKTQDIDVTGGNVEPIREKVRIQEHVQDLIKEAKKTENGELVYMLIPKGISLNKLVAIAAAAPRQPGEAPLIEYVWDSISTQVGDREVAETRIVAISTSVLTESRNKTFSEQKNLVGNGFKVARILETSMLHIVMKIFFSKCLYSSRATFMRSDEHINGWKLVVGSLAPRGLYVDFLCVDGDVGVAALRKF